MHWDSYEYRTWTRIHLRSDFKDSLGFFWGFLQPHSPWMPLSYTAWKASKKLTQTSFCSCSTPSLLMIWPLRTMRQRNHTLYMLKPSEYWREVNSTYKNFVPTPHHFQRKWIPLESKEWPQLGTRKKCPCHTRNHVASMTNRSQAPKSNLEPTNKSGAAEPVWLLWIWPDNFMANN